MRPFPSSPGSPWIETACLELDPSGPRQTGDAISPCRVAGTIAPIYQSYPAASSKGSPTKIRTPVTDAFGLSIPIISAGIAMVAGPAGSGNIGALTRRKDGILTTTRLESLQRAHYGQRGAVFLTPRDCLDRKRAPNRLRHPARSFPGRRGAKRYRPVTVPK